MFTGRLRNVCGIFTGTFAGKPFLKKGFSRALSQKLSTFAKGFARELFLFKKDFRENVPQQA
jgi:hypothetical protein